MREAHALEGPVLMTQPHTGRTRESLGVLRGRGQTGMSPGALQSPGLLAARELRVEALLPNRVWQLACLQEARD